MNRFHHLMDAWSDMDAASRRESWVIAALLCLLLIGAGLERVG